MWKMFSESIMDVFFVQKDNLVRIANLMTPKVLDNLGLLMTSGGTTKEEVEVATLCLFLRSSWRP